jgi:small subunit ribosomal protein S3
MGQKTHPIGFRLGVIKEWQSKWFAAKDAEFRDLLQEDLRIRASVLTRYRDAGISQIHIERGNQDLIVTVHTARPGIVIGRGGQRIEELRQSVETLTGKRTRLNVQEIRQPELDAYLVARNICDQLERRIAFRRAIRQAIARAMQAGAKGIKVVCSGRLGGSEIARVEKAREGRVPLHTLRADIDYGLAEAATAMGKIGVKVWIFKGEVLPTPQEELEELGAIEVTLSADELALEDTAMDSMQETEVATEESATIETTEEQDNASTSEN